MHSLNSAPEARSYSYGNDSEGGGNNHNGCRLCGDAAEPGGLCDRCSRVKAPISVLTSDSKKITLH